MERSSYVTFRLLRSFSSYILEFTAWVFPTVAYSNEERFRVVCMHCFFYRVVVKVMLVLRIV